MRAPAASKSSHVILPDLHLTVMRFTGSVSLGDVTRGIERLQADPAYDPRYNGIVNLEGVTTRASINDVRALLTFLTRPRTSSGHWAVIFTEPKATALALVFKAASPGPFRLEIVSTWEAACRYLGVDLPRVA